MPRILLLALVFLALGGVPTRAQAPDPILEPFNRYALAMREGDLAAAEGAAEAAYDASRSRDGEGGSTGVLAFNLASLRLLLEQYEPALDPARLALHAAEAGTSTDVDPLRARLVVARAELGASSRADDVALQQLLTDAAALPSLAGDVHYGAIQLARWRFAHGRYAGARAAWAVAASTARGSMFGVNHGRGVALLGDATALMFEEADRPPHRISAEKTQEIDRAFNESMRLLWRAADRSADATQVRPEHAAYAEAMAWRLVWQSHLQSRARRDNARLAEGADPPYPTGYWQIGVSGDASLPECQIAVDARPPPLLPTETDHVDAGAAVIWIRFDVAGEVAEKRVAALAGGNARFARSIRDLASRWRVEFEGPRPPACRLPASTYRSVVFRFRE